MISAQWVQERLDSPDYLILDPRSPVRYMAGHPKNAINVPIAQARDAQGSLLPAEDLAGWLGSAGLDARTPVIYDSADGRNAAFLAWILLYLGRSDVHLMSSFWEQWLSDGREVFYRPVRSKPRGFTAVPRRELRITTEELNHAAASNAPAAAPPVQASSVTKLVDFRSAQEFSGELDTDGRPGHIPGAIHLSWQDLGADGALLASPDRLQSLLAARAISKDDTVIAYCRTGVRAALGFLALAQVGCRASLYDGSFSEWASRGLPVERQFQKKKKEGEAHA